MTYDDFRSLGEISYPFAKYYKEVSMGRKWYCMSFSPIAHLINESRNLLSNTFQEENKPKLTKKELTLLSDKLHIATHSEKNLIVILFESLEHWCINTQLCGQEITPNLNKLMRDKNVLSSLHCIPQTKQGKSSDAQLIICTGLLPTKDGAVCMRFPSNYFPSIVEAMTPRHSNIYVPTPSSSWNQGIMTKSYHFNNLYAQTVSDKEILQNVTEDIEKCRDNFCFLTTTMASHSPFTSYCDSSKIQLQTDMPGDIKNYLLSVNYTDECIGILLNKIKQDSLLSQNTTVVITGDHTIFTDDDRKQISNILNTEASKYVPLFIYSADLQNTTIENECYQMDIFPTLLYLLGCEDYYWTGLGMNLLTKNGRRTSENDAFEISDKLIRNDYFSKK
jgi:phosphoglycerol transferase MdoB-like AlkP superfamily enzyme